MSVKQTWMVWERDIGGRDQLILLALADMADDFGGSLFPSMEYISWKTGLSVDTIRRSLRELAASGVLEKLEDATPRRSARYRLQLARLPLKSAYIRKRPSDQGSQIATSEVAGCEGRGRKLPSDPTNLSLIHI